MRHPRYCLTHHSGISSNINNAAHFSAPPTPRSQHTAHCTYIGIRSRWHVTLAHRRRKPRQHVTHTGTSPTLACQQRKHTTHVSMPPTQARYPRHPCQHKQRAISRTLGYPLKLLKLLALKFQEEIQQFLLLVFIFATFNFQAFLSIFIEAWKTATEKLNFFRGKQSVRFKRRLFFQKQIHYFFKKKLFPNICVVLVILCVLSLKKYFPKDQLPLS